MPSIYKRKYWADAATGAKVRKGTEGAVERESKVYTIRYVDAAGKPQRRKGYASLRATEQLASRLMKDLALGNEGLVDPHATEKRRPLSDHLTDFLDFQATRGRDAEYLYILNRRITKALEELGWKFFGDVDAGRFEKWMAEYAAREEVSGKTVNQFLDSLRALLNWCCDKNRNRFPLNPLSRVEKLPHAVTFERRSLTAEEIAALLKVCQGTERGRVYRFAIGTGLRRQEIADLQWGDVMLDTPTPFLKLRASATKSRRGDQLPLRTDIAAELKTVRGAEWAVSGQVFASVPTVEEFRNDLRAAGVKIPTDRFDRYDFHGLRTTLGSLLAKQGTAPRVAMQLMRHTDMRLTQNIYTDPRIFDSLKEVDNLPLTPATPELERMKATGTDGGECAQSGPPNTYRNPDSSAANCNQHLSASAPEGIEAEVIAPHSASISLVMEESGKTERLGIEPTQSMPKSSENLRFPQAVRTIRATSPTPAVHGDTRCDELETIATAWPNLPAQVRQTILLLISSTTPGT